MPLNQKARTALWGILVLIVAVGVGFGLNIGRAVMIKNYGIELKPTRIYEPQKVPFYLQNDPQWADDKLGKSACSMGNYGCLVSALAAAISNMGYEVDPKVLNDKFRQGHVYTNSGEVIWFKIKDVFPPVSYRYLRVFDGKTIEKDLQEGRVPIVKVRYFHTGAFHWVLVVGSDEEDFLIMDPLNREKRYSRLNTHGKVYGYRALMKE